MIIQLKVNTIYIFQTIFLDLMIFYIYIYRFYLIIVNFLSIIFNYFLFI